MTRRSDIGWNPAISDFPSNKGATSAETAAAHEASLRRIALEARIDEAVNLALNDLEGALPGMRRVEIARALILGACRARDAFGVR